jgi:hypothetical protein
MSSSLVFRNTVSHIGIFDPSCELLPFYLLSDLPQPPLLPKVNAQYLYADSVWLWGGGVSCCVVDHILQEFNTLFLTRFRTYKNCYTTPNKNTSKDDILGLVSL